MIQVRLVLDSYYLRIFCVDLEQDTDNSFLTAEYLANLLPIAYGSPTFTDCEKHYGNIERKLLAVVFDIENLLIIHLEGTQSFFLTIGNCPVSMHLPDSRECYSGCRNTMSVLYTTRVQR